MPATPFKRRSTRDGGADLRVVSPLPHLALVPAAPPAKADGSEPVRTAERLAPGAPGRTPQELFCARLRATRERHGLTVDAVASSTKVAASHFTALERGDVSRWPKGLYRRSFFRSYAVAIGLPADSAVDEFLSLFPDEDQPVAEPAAKPGAEPALRLTMGIDTRRDAWQRALSPAVILDGLAVLVLALALVWWLGASIWAAVAVIVLCYYPSLARSVRRRVKRRIH